MRGGGFTDASKLVLPILFFVSFFSVRIFASTDADVRFLRGLVDRNMFETVEYFCDMEFRAKKPDSVQKLRLVTELVRSRTRQMILTEPSNRERIRNRLDELETELLGPVTGSADPEAALARSSLRFQLAISDYSLGDWQRLEADAASNADRDEQIKQARQTLYDSLERFKRCSEEITALRHRSSGADPTFQRRTQAMFWAVRSQWSLAQVSLGLSFPPGEDRKFSLDRAVEMLLEPAGLGIADPVVYRARIELARCYRLLDELDKSKEQLMILDNVKLNGEVMLAAKAELIRYYLAVGAAAEAVRLFETPDTGMAVDPDYDIARLELLLAENARLRQAAPSMQEDFAREETETMLTRIVEQVQFIEQKSGPYWGRRARMLLSSAHGSENGAKDEKMAANASIVKLLADDRYQSGNFIEASQLYRQASRMAENAGETENAFSYAAASVAVQAELSDRLTRRSKRSEPVSIEELSVSRKRLIDSIRELSKRFPDNSNSPEYHLKAVDLTAEAVKARQVELGDYIEILKEHAELWSDSRKVPPSLLQAALLVEQQGDPNEALSILEKIPNASAVGLEAVRAACRCFEALSANDASGNVFKNNVQKEAEWFRRRLTAEPDAWLEADAISALRAAECHLVLHSKAENEASEHPKTAEKLLRAASQCPELPPASKAQVQALLVRALADQGRKDEAAEALRNLDDDRIESLPSAERLAFQLVRARLLAETDETQKAVNLLGGLLNRHPNDLSVRETLAEILTRQTDPKALNRAMLDWSKIVSETDAKSDLWWTARERIIEIYLKLGQTDKAKKQFEVLRQLHPELGGSARKARLEKRFEKE